MSARGIPVQDTYPDWLQLKPVQEGDLAEKVEEAPKSKRAAKKAAAPVEEAPVVEEPAADEAAE